MATYIGSLQVNSDAPVLLGSTLYGICNSPATLVDKVVTLNNFDSIVDGITIHVKFTYGNNILNGATLAVGATSAFAVSGNCVCEPGEVIAFTLERANEVITWRSNHSVKIDEENNIITKIAGQTVNLATRRYVDDIVQGGDSAGTMHYKGVSVNEISHGGVETAIINGDILDAETGDLVVYGSKEFIWTGRVWHELGDEDSYALKSSTTNIQSAITWDEGSTPSLGADIEADDITNWEAGSASEAKVQNGVLKIKNSTVPTLRYTQRQIPNVTNVGTVPSLTVASTTVVVP